MDRSKLLSSLAKTIADYEGSGFVAAPEHVDRWISQFDKPAQNPILTEMNHVLQRTYISASAFQGFLKKLVRNERLASDNAKAFWRRAGILDIQQAGTSQHEMLKVVDEALQSEYGITLQDCDASSGEFLYIDDGIFGGGHVRNDLSRWIKQEAPEKATVHIIAMALHTGGQYFAETQLKKAAAEAGKKIQLRWWKILEAENRRAYINQSDVLIPTRIPDHRLTRAYVQMLKDSGYPPLLRNPGSIGRAKFFSSEAGRDMLEQEFLKAGTEIRNACPYLNEYQRPLGNMVLKTLGFGGLVVTFRNCPNNCPLALWAGDPWYPLFPRKINK